MAAETATVVRRRNNKHVSCRRDSLRPLPLDHAVRLIQNVCRLAGSANIIDDLQQDRSGDGLRAIIARGDNAGLFNWLIDAVSYQGISDQVAYNYLELYGRLTWPKLEADLATSHTCAKLQSYWHFEGCRYDKLSRTCAEPEHIRACPLPRHLQRNGRLNQTGYSLFLFIRDIADGDLIGWIDHRLAQCPHDKLRVAVWARNALIEPLRNIYGVSDKVLMMALSCILISAPDDRPNWLEAGMSMIAIDTLVHNFMKRTGILDRLDADHAYGADCYRSGGCADIVSQAASKIDARIFNSEFPQVFPRFVQHAIWRYCSQQGLNICNGNRIDDGKSCQNIHCQIYSICDKIRL